jgi:nicotinamidase-related amidase
MSSAKYRPNVGRRRGQFCDKSRTISRADAASANSAEKTDSAPGKGAFYATPLQDLLAAHGIAQLLFAGVTTAACVQTTMREANDRGYECRPAEDATERYFPDFKHATLDMIRAAGAIVGWTATIDDIMAALAAG